MNGQSFAFHGYLPVAAGDRAAALRRLEEESRALRRAQLFIETPYRNAAMWDSLLKTLQPPTRLAVASGLTLPEGFTHSRQVRTWRQQGVPIKNDTPAVFAIGR